MEKIVHYIGLDVHNETIGVPIESTARRTDILASLARRSRKVRDGLFVGTQGSSFLATLG